MNNQKNFSTYVAAILVIFVFLFLIKWFDISYPLSLTTVTRSGELSVVGEGKTEATPDTAYVDVGITVNNSPTVEMAQKSINDTNNKIVEAMKKLNIKKEDIKTSNYSIYPNYVYEASQNRITGYNGNVSISIKIKDTQKTANVIEEATKAGANNIQGTRFVVDNPDSYREKARELAIANAKEQAQKLAKSLGIRLGRIVNVNESTSGGISSRIKYASAISVSSSGGAGDDSAQFEPGSQTITSVVTLYFEKK